MCVCVCVSLCVKVCANIHEYVYGVQICISVCACECVCALPCLSSMTNRHGADAGGGSDAAGVMATFAPLHTVESTDEPSPTGTGTHVCSLPSSPPGSTLTHPPPRLTPSYLSLSLPLLVGSVTEEGPPPPPLLHLCARVLPEPSEIRVVPRGSPVGKEKLFWFRVPSSFPLFVCLLDLCWRQHHTQLWPCANRTR